MNSFQPVIKWSGSKRSQSLEIVQKFPVYNRYFEPFVGGGSILYAANPIMAFCSDINKPLIDLWLTIQNDPNGLLDYYQIQWNNMKENGHEVYYSIRNKFNKSFSPYDLFFLSRTCVNGLIRFNQNGEFNNSLHHTRHGINPHKLKDIVMNWSNRLKNVNFSSCDYHNATQEAVCGDLVYLDPPYFNTKGRYYNLSTIDFNEFFEYLNNLNERNIKWILSFDGKTSTRDYTIILPPELYKNHYYLYSGYSSFQKVMGKTINNVFESLYTSF